MFIHHLKHEILLILKIKITVFFFFLLQTIEKLKKKIRIYIQ